MPDTDPTKNIEYYANQIAAAEHVDLTQCIREARNELGETEWTGLVGIISVGIDNTRHSLLQPLVSVRVGPFDWILESFYAEVLARLDIGTVAMLQLISDALKARPAEDRWTILRGFEVWAGNRGDRPGPCLDAIVAGSAPTDLVAPALRAGLLLQRKAYREHGLAFIASGSEPIAIAAAEVLAGQNPIGKGAVRQTLSAIRKRCAILQGEPRPRLFEAALGLAIRTTPNAVAPILKLAEPASPAPYLSACARQLVIADKAPDASVVGLISEALLQAHGLEPQTLSYLDDAIRRWLTVDSSHAAFADLLVRMILETGATFDTLDSSAGALLQVDSERRDAILGRLLASDTFEGAHAAYQVALKAFGEPLEPKIDFVPHVLDTETTQRIARRVAGLFAIVPVAATSILLSLLRTGPVEAADEVSSLIMDPVLISYWEDAGDYLRKRLELETGDMSALIEALIARLEGYVEAIRAVGFIEEMFPPERQRFLRALKKDAESRTITRKANEESLIASLFQTRLVLNGDSAIYRVTIGDGESTRAEQPMQAIEHSHALPRLDAIDPFGYWYRRRLLMNGLSA